VGAKLSDKLVNFEHLIGVYFDAHIAREAGVSQETVKMHRYALGLDPGTNPLPNQKQVMLNRWACVPERVGKSRNQWRDYLASC